MGCYEDEKALVEAGKETRGKALRDYFAECDVYVPEGMEAHRPDYTDTLLAESNDDIYRDFCRWFDQPKPRYFDTVPDPVVVDGYTAADIYQQMIANNWRQNSIDAAAVYDMLVMLRDEPELAHKLIGYKPTCYRC